MDADQKRPQNNNNPKNAGPGFHYDDTPMVHHFPGNTENCFDQVNQYGTYEIQRTCDTANFFPAIAQGLPKNADFRIWTKNMPDMNEE